MIGNCCRVDLTNYEPSVTELNDTVVFALTNANKNVQKFEFLIQFSGGYWYLSGINVTEKANNKIYSLKVKEVYAPVGFSYHCTDGIFYGFGVTSQNLTLPKFQVSQDRR